MGENTLHCFLLLIVAIVRISLFVYIYAMQDRVEKKAKQVRYRLGKSDSNHWYCGMRTMMSLDRMMMVNQA